MALTKKIDTGKSFWARLFNTTDEAVKEEENNSLLMRLFRGAGEKLQNIQSPDFTKAQQDTDELKQNDDLGSKLIAVQNQSALTIGKPIIDFAINTVKDYGSTFTKVGNRDQLGAFDYLNLMDFMPGVGLFAGGVETIGRHSAKEVLEKATREGAEDLTVKAGKEFAEKEVKQEIDNRLAHLVNYHNELRHMGFTEEEAGKIGAKEAQKIISGITREVDANTAFRTAVDAKEFEQDLNRLNFNVRQKVNAIDYVRTPENVLKKIGLEDQSKYLRSSYDSYKKDLRTEIDKLITWKNRVPEKGSERRIFRYLDGKAGQNELTGDELQVANEMKSYFKTWAKKLHLPEDKQISNYITHIFERGSVEKEFDPELEKLISQSGVPGSVYNPFLETRTNKQDYIQDAFRATEAYIKRATRKYNLDPALNEIKDASEYLDEASYNYVKRYLSNVNMRPAEVDNLFDNLVKSSPAKYKFGQRPTTKLSTDIRQMIYRATLGLNPSSAIKNLSQGSNTYAELGERYTISGYVDFFNRAKSGGLEELIKEGVLDDDIIEKKLYANKNFMRKLDGTLFAMFENVEKINRGAAYYGAKRKAIANGATSEEAVQIAKDTVRKTQFTFGSIDTPVGLQNDMTKLLGQFTSFPIKQTEFLLGKVKNKEYAGLIRYIGASMLFYHAIGKHTGARPTDLIPFYGELTGSSRFPIAPSAQILFNARDIVSPDEDVRKRGVNNIDKSLSLMVPAGTQIRKSLMGADTVLKGKSTDSAGRKQYKVSQSDKSLLQAILFGKYSLPEAREYYKKK